MRIAICDDAPQDAAHVQVLTEQWLHARGLDAEIARYPSAEAFLISDAAQTADVLLLDVEMGAMDGVTLAKTIRRTNQAMQIVFITGYSDYLADGYEVAALNYLMKPLDAQKFFAVLDRARERQQAEERCLNLDLSGEIVRIPFHAILYVDVRQNYVTVHTSGALFLPEYTVKRTLSDMAQQLDERFCRVGRSMCVNLRRIRRVTRTQVLLNDGTSLPLPRGAYDALNRAIIDLT